MEATTTLTARALSDYTLVQSAVNGNQDAFSTLFERYRSAVFQFMSQRASNPTEALDLTMEAFEKAFIKLSAYAPTHAFSTWLFKIALNNCIDHSRKKRLPLAREDERDLLAQIRDEASTPEEELLRQERIALVVTLVQRLSHRYRNMIQLRYYEEMSYEEIANHLSLPVGTVKAQIFRAKEMMLRMLKAPIAQA